ncbi:MAG: hypothetical protein JXB07_02500 [Anaerolineae bacterium]|nr:hypothetical protein [Anaerolineae bacterium]
MERVRVLLIGRPGPLRDGLSVLVQSIPQIEEIVQADDLTSVFRLGDEYLPCLVILADARKGIHLGETLSQLRNRWPQARHIVMVDNERDFLSAELAGADKVLYQGCRAGNLIEIIGRVLS